MTRQSHLSPPSTNRARVYLVALLLGFLSILARLFYWQIVEGAPLSAAADLQYQRLIELGGKRGQILTSDGYLLVGNTVTYRLVGHPHLVDRTPEELSLLLSPFVLKHDDLYLEASESAQRNERSQVILDYLNDKLSQTESKWVSLATGLSLETVTSIQELSLKGLSFEAQPSRLYPEASMAAHLTGFLGKDTDGNPTGYFGVEGALNRELAGKTRRTTLTTDAHGTALLDQLKNLGETTEGRDAVLTIRRDLQSLVEQLLAQGMKRYGAQAGEVVILEPSTGKILALASFPVYNQATYYTFEPSLYKNPTLTELYEPGSVLKTLTVAAGIDTGVITPDTACPQCEGPRLIDKYTIKTWNNEYHPNITMRDALAKSDNVAMIYIAEQLGADRWKEYLQNFGIGEPLNLDLQEDGSTPFPKKWGPVELATTSFGQGISTNSLQLVRAVSAIANDGVMMQPLIIEKVLDPESGKELINPVKEYRRVISAETARQVTEMMVHAAQSGEAQWTYSQSHVVAGKTGTSQIATEGGYASDRTIASFIGFSPPENPRFIMLVKLVEPQTSPWAAETAAPLWYRIAEKVFLLLNIPPDAQ